MFTIRSSGSIAQMIAEVRDIPVRVLPYAAATALTRCAQRAAKRDIPAEMRRVFKNPTPYTLNSLFVKSATKDSLSARVMVKDSVSRGVVPEKFLSPEVFGGGRNEKGFEKALRFAGLLNPGERVVPARDMQLDPYGNVPGSRIRSILKALETSRGGANLFKKEGRRFVRTKGGKKIIVEKGRYGEGIYAGQVGKTRGIWQRSVSGKVRKTKPMFIFTSKPPIYARRLDFHAIVQKTAEINFKNEFSAAAAAILGR